MAFVYYIPCGPKNLADLFPSLDFSEVESYTVQALTSSGVTQALASLDVSEIVGLTAGTNLAIKVVADPIIGGAEVLFGTYVIQSSDTDSVTLAGHIVAYIHGLTLTGGKELYHFDNFDGAVVVSAPSGYGPVLNGEQFVLQHSLGSITADFAGGSSGTQTVIATSPLNVVEKLCDNDIKLHFVQYPGAVDSVPLKVVDVQHDSKSDLFQLPTVKPLVKSVHSINRFNIKANDIYTVQGLFREEDLNWIQEMFDSPFSWIELSGSQGQNDDYLPIVISDQKLQKLKSEDRYEYLVTISFSLSNEKITHRG